MKKITTESGGNVVEIAFKHEGGEGGVVGGLKKTNCMLFATSFPGSRSFPLFLGTRLCSSYR